MAVQTLSKENFDEVILKSDLVVVDFWAKWCAPCRGFGETIEALAEEFPEVTFAKVDIENEPELATDFDIRSIPMVMLFKGNIAVFKESGALSKETMIDLIQQAKKLDVSEIKQWIETQSEKS